MKAFDPISVATLSNSVASHGERRRPTAHSPVRVPASEKNQYLEYEFTANDLADFSGYRIKVVMSSTDQANYPIIRDLRTLALK